MQMRLIPIWPDYVRDILKKKSRNTWSAMKKEGRAPKSVYVGRKEFTTQQWHDDWIISLAKREDIAA